MTLIGVQEHLEDEDRHDLYISGFTLWDRVLRVEEIKGVGETCHGFTTGNPVVSWDDFYEPVKANAAGSLISPSQCRPAK